MRGQPVVVNTGNGVGGALGDEAAGSTDGAGVAARSERCHGVVGVPQRDAHSALADIGLDG